jgi:putative endonuclease
MACLYILYSEKLGRHYIGSCDNLEHRLKEHREKFFEDAFTTRADDWVLVFSLCDLIYEQARKIEKHIKKMKSGKYIHNLVRYKEMSEKLKRLYET